MKIAKQVSAAALSLGLVVGLSGLASGLSGDIDTTGPKSTNKIIEEWNSNVKVDNHNKVNVDVDNDQDADSGDATVYGNTNGGSATSGSASNTNSSSVTINLSN